MILWFFGLCALCGAVLGIVQPSKQPQRPTRQTIQYTPKQGRSVPDNSAEIAFLECKLVQLEDLQRMIEHEYQHAKTAKQAISAHRQMIALDDKIHATTRKLGALKHD